jgi:hypothetical protein
LQIAAIWGKLNGCSFSLFPAADKASKAMGSSIAAKGGPDAPNDP